MQGHSAIANELPALLQKNIGTYPSAAAAPAAPKIVAARDAGAAEGLDVELALLRKARARWGPALLGAPLPAHVQALQGLAGQLIEEVVLLIHLFIGRALTLHLWLDLLQNTRACVMCCLSRGLGYEPHLLAQQE